MVCYHPIDCILPAVEDKNGKKHLIFKKNNDGLLFDDSPIVRDIADYANIRGFKIKVPCGRCIGCRLDYSRHWAIRSIHEAFMHTANTFVTLTFNDEHLPENYSLSKPYITSWLKRFRKQFGSDIRYMLCGEYGEKHHRPHYHILFYNFTFPDKEYWSTRNGQIYYRSSMLEKLWSDPWSCEPRGFSVIGDVTFESSAYVARYVTKKFFSKDSYAVKKYYNDLEPEFMLMSRRPGLGNDYIHQYYEDIFNHGYIVLPNKSKAPIPRYYINELKLIDEDFYNRYKVDKLHELYNNLFIENIDTTQQRLEVREELKKQKCDKLIRIYEMDDLLHNI